MLRYGTLSGGKMVVSEAKIVFGLRDVVRVRFRCQICGHEAVMRLDAAKQPTITKHCPLCNGEWLTRLGAEHVNKMLEAFARLDTHKVDVLIEIDAPSEQR